MTAAAVDIATLRKLTPVGQLAPDAIQEVARKAKFHRARAGAHLFRANDSDDHSIFLIDGAVELMANGKDAQTIISGTTMAETPLAPQQPRAATARAKTDVRLVVVSSSLLLTLLHPPSKGQYDVGEINVQDEDIEGRLLCDIFEDYVAEKLEVPSLPDIALRIRKTVDDPEVNVADVVRLVSSDPSIAAQLIQIANSAAYRGNSPIETCRDAVVRLGLTTTRELVSSIAMKSLFRTQSAMLKKKMQELWFHSTYVAAISALVAKRNKGINPDRALLAGLVHDVGALSVIMRAEHYTELLSDPAQLDLAIAKLRGQVGTMILRKWEFPDDMVTTAMEAEDWERNSESADCCDVVMVAHLLSVVGKPAAATLPALADIPAAEKLGLGGLAGEVGLEVIDEAGESLRNLHKALTG